MGKLSKPEELSSNPQCSCQKLATAMGLDSEPRAVEGGDRRVAEVC